MSVTISAIFAPTRPPRALLDYRLRCSACAQEWTAPSTATGHTLDKLARVHLDTCEAPR